LLKPLLVKVVSAPRAVLVEKREISE
jgi:hypothetical protein